MPRKIRELHVGIFELSIARSKNKFLAKPYFYFLMLKNCLRMQFAYLQRAEFVKVLRGFRVYLHVAANFLSALRLFPKRRHCEFCGWSGFGFIPIYYVDCYRADVFCPQCRMMDRYRSLVHYVRQSEWGVHIRESRPRVLDVAPTEYSRRMLVKEFGARESIGFDISNPRADVIGDLQDICFPDKSFDLFLCYEVLDLVPKDEVALNELWRVLRPGGYGIIRVGFNDKSQTTVEYSKPNADDSCHIRRYGLDLQDRFRTAGFEVELVYLTQSVLESERQRLGLDATPVFFLRRPLKNERLTV